MKKTIFLALASVVLLGQTGSEEARQIFTEIDRSLEELTQITGLKIHKKIEYDFISRDKVNQFLRDRLKEVVKPAEIRAEELTLKKFGFVPQDFNLEKTTVDLLTEQAAAFYDYHKKKLFLTDWAPSAMQQAALVHELAHALADQHFHLERFIQRGGKNDDSALARMGVMEGQATWLMSEYLARKSGQSLATSASLFDLMTKSTEMGAGQFPVFNGAPLYLQQTLIFPYTKGMQFQQAVFLREGKESFAVVFRHPPVSTQQILHPQKYFLDAVPTSPALPPLATNQGYKRLAEGTIGELDHSILLEQYAGKEQADTVSPHWRGGRYALLENAQQKRVVLAYAVEWDSPETAAQFFNLYGQVLRKKWKDISIRTDTEKELAGQAEDGYFTVHVDGAVMRSLEGLPSPQ
jgi:hypothetical protein